MSAVAAALVLSVTVCVSNPALAAKLPFIGNIFQTVNEDSSYPGDFSKDAMQLVKPGEQSLCTDQQWDYLYHLRM